MNKFSTYIPENNIRRIVFLRNKKIAVISRNGREKEEGPCIYLFDNKLKLLSILDRNEIYAGASLNLIELRDSRIISFSRSPILRVWNRFGRFLEEWENPFFGHGTVQLSGGRIVTVCGTGFILREENGRKIKTVNASINGWPVRTINNLSGDRFLTDNWHGEKYLWNKNGKKIGYLPLSTKERKKRVFQVTMAKDIEFYYFDENGNCCCFEKVKKESMQMISIQKIKVDKS